MFKRSGTTLTSAVKLTTIVDPSSVITEQIKTIRTNINFAATDHKLRTIMVTSATLGEGKSTISGNLAVEYANEGLNVLLVDADLRRPTIHKTFGLTNRVGLSSCLGRQTRNINEAIHHQTVDNLVVMTSGPKPPNPAELLGGKMMDEFLNSETRQFDLVIIDAPPILPVTDSQLLANKVDGTVLVVRENVAQKAAVKEAVKALKRSHATILGVVLNDVSDGHHNGYYGYSNGYYSDEER
ncbi:CpsD/CapB family tyrosine-protein kinase [Lactiplantibacillus sp. WILCCON 0030]|uniref:CpsD/CapB family tyrosine-protein kinase n=1 Tax=Lactiplantibacillus brownii TaxID=3069269 RepID=A0ABU1A9V8_9LACO|nr:CpsD/CapB family tyrosine-protein kinase [Lactiplantibacillus brownii]MDQ7937719.1 CpsD/CapB family tyrosine-protein kinase [Lactiplantibacillus brownii]